MTESSSRSKKPTTKPKRRKFRAEALDYSVVPLDSLKLRRRGSAWDGFIQQVEQLKPKESCLIKVPPESDPETFRKHVAGMTYNRLVFGKKPRPALRYRAVLTNDGKAVAVHAVLKSQKKK